MVLQLRIDDTKRQTQLSRRLTTSVSVGLRHLFSHFKAAEIFLQQLHFPLLHFHTTLHSRLPQISLSLSLCLDFPSISLEMSNERIPESERRQIEHIRELESEELQVEEVDDSSSDGDHRSLSIYIYIYDL